MRPFFAIIRTEVQLLLKDIPGLMILFVMPMLLVLILTTLHSVEAEHPKKIALLVINKDTGKIGQEFIDKIQKHDTFQLSLIDKKSKINEENYKNQIAHGDYQALLIIPEGLTSSVKKYTTWLARPNGNKPKMKTFEVYLDPMVPFAFKNAIQTELEKLDQRIQIKSMQEILKKILNGEKFNKEQPATQINLNYANKEKNLAKPNPVQQYVPAWTIFGMFLIMIPLAGLYVKEREYGIIQRFAVAPIPKIYFILGRLVAFIGINLIQLCLMFCLGIFVLPLIGLESLNLDGHYAMIALSALCISAAATGFGIFLGIYSRTFEQAMALGPTLIVINAAIGGIMAPPYLMPEPLRIIGEYSPLFWSQNSFIQILVRQASFQDVGINLIKLLIFFLATLVLSTMRYLKKG